MWKPEHRRAADRRGLRYPSDPSDAEWALVEPLMAVASMAHGRLAVVSEISYFCEQLTLHHSAPAVVSNLGILPST
jgi:hypothetical protein